MVWVLALVLAFGLVLACWFEALALALALALVFDAIPLALVLVLAVAFSGFRISALLGFGLFCCFVFLFFLVLALA